MGSVFLIAGYDQRDGTSCPDSGYEFGNESLGTLAGIRLGIPEEFSGRVISRGGNG